MPNGCSIDALLAYLGVIIKLLSFSIFMVGERLLAALSKLLVQRGMRPCMPDYAATMQNIKGARRDQ